MATYYINYIHIHLIIRWEDVNKKYKQWHPYIIIPLEMDVKLINYENAFISNTRPKLAEPNKMTRSRIHKKRKS